MKSIVANQDHPVYPTTLEDARSLWAMVVGRSSADPAADTPTQVIPRSEILAELDAAVADMDEMFQRHAAEDGEHGDVCMCVLCMDSPGEWASNEYRKKLAEDYGR